MARTRHDDLAKILCQLWLARFGSVQLDTRISAEARRGDVLLTADGSDDPTWRRDLGPLGRLARGLLLVEPFRGTPTTDEIDSCVAKRIELRAGQLRATRDPDAQVTRAARRRLPPVTVLVVTPHLPANHRHRYGIDPRAVGGVYETTPALGLVVAVVDELPREPGTVWLRLLGRGSVQAGAIGEVLRRAGRDPVVDATLKAVRQWRESLPVSAEQSEKERMEMMRFEKLLAAADKREALLREQALREGERKGKAEGKEEGLAAGLRVAIADLCEVLGVKVGAARLAKLAAMDLAELTALRGHLKQHRAWPSARR